MKERVTLDQKEQNRLIVLSWAERGMMTTREAAQILGLSLRQSRRILGGYRKEGAAALAHGNRGKRPRHTLDAGIKKKECCCRLMVVGMTGWRGEGCI